MMRTREVTTCFLVRRRIGSLLFCLVVLGLALTGLAASLPPEQPAPGLELSHTGSETNPRLIQVLSEQVHREPFKLVATLLFVMAIVHTFLSPFFVRLSHRLEAEHQQRLARLAGPAPGRGSKTQVSFRAGMCSFLGEIEAVFGIWVIPLMVCFVAFNGWDAAREYLGAQLNFTEPVFVVVIMSIAASRPVLKFSEQLMALAARPGKGSPAAWWLSILTIGPLLGSLITEPAAMTISALLLAAKFYERKPSPQFAYATLGLLFVNISVGGTLTHCAAPPVLMVAGKWGWDFGHMLLHFGWKAVAAIVTANLLYFLWFRRELKRLAPAQLEQKTAPEVHAGADEPIPVWVTGIHILFLAWTVLNNHFPVLFIGGFLFYLAFLQVTEHHQEEVQLRPALLVGFFLAGLVVHGGLQSWWLAPVLSGLKELPLFFGATVLTAFNDNAAITYLAAQVPGFTDPLKYAVVAGAVAGGGLTVIANAPNPAGQSILSKFFPEGISPLGLFLGGLLPTLIVVAAFLLFATI
jgi:Na+/H+ antiporter NhaD/arsenite permease-like protein